jgi:hypothetical protein
MPVVKACLLSGVKERQAVVHYTSFLAHASPYLSSLDVFLLVVSPLFRIFVLLLLLAASYAS